MSKRDSAIANPASLIFNRIALATVFVALLGSSAFAATIRPVRDGAFDVLDRASRAGDRVVVTALPLDSGIPFDLELERFEVFAPDARVHLSDGNGVRIEAPPAMSFFRGRVAGDSASTAVVSLRDGVVQGLIVTSESVFAIEREPSGIRKSSGIRSDDLVYTVRQLNPELDNPRGTEPFRCDVEGATFSEFTTDTLAATKIAANATTDPAATYRMRLAIETDVELRNKFASNADLLAYVAELVAASSTIYSRDASTELVLGDVFTYAGAVGSDPWEATQPMDAMLELGGHWNTDPVKSLLSRSLVHLLSGKDSNGGIAWVGRACRGDFLCNGENCGPGIVGIGGAYGMTGAITGTVNTNNPNVSTYWDALAFSHEMGHNFNSNHTHCIKADAIYGRSFVDSCVSGESSGSGPCYSGATSVPGEKGTIMSYCHLRSGGYPNVRMIFGQEGEASEAVQTILRDYMNLFTPNGDLIAGESVCPGSTGNVASVADSPGVTFEWGITNGTITGGQSTSEITWTAGASGSATTLEVTITNSRGCAVINTREITLANAVAAITAPATVGANSTGNDASVPNAGAGATYTWGITGGTITSGQGTRAIKFTAGGSGSVNLTVTVVANGCTSEGAESVPVDVPNQEPSFTSVPVLDGIEDVDYVYAVVATDLDDGAVLEITATTTPSWLALTDNGDGTAALTGTPRNAHVGANSVTLAVSDGEDTDTQSFTITVTNVNDAPSFTSEAVTTATLDVTYEYEIEATDPDVGEDLEITATVLPAWLTLTDNGDGTATLSGTPGAADEGTHNVTLLVDDGALTDTQVFAIEVSNLPNGDANGDTAVTASDIFYLINNLFGTGAAPVGPADVNGDTVVTASDIFYLINFLFASGAPPV